MKRFNPAALVAEETGSAVIFSPPPEPDPIVIATAAERRRQQEEQTAKRERLFTEHYGQPGADKVAVPHGMMAVTISLCYDNSDSMTDYFDRHANLSPEFVLLVVKKQAETERLARRALAVAFPDGCPSGTGGSASLAWEWHTEKWSMGHGNYLDSSGFELPDVLKNLETRYRGGGVTHGHWEIEFRRPYTDGGELHLLPYKNFGTSVTARPLTASEPPERDTLTAKLLETKHTKTQATIFVVQLANRVDRGEYERINGMARSLGGYYSSYRRDGAVPGFIFKDNAQAETFLAKLTAPKPEPVSVPSPPPTCHVPQIAPMPGFTPLGLPSSLTAATPSWQQRFRRP